MKKTQKTFQQSGSVRRIDQGDADYPSTLKYYLRDHTPESIATLGDIDILWRRGKACLAPTLALFCSVKCPGKLILQTYDLAQNLRRASVPIIGGFHSPIERECLTILIRGTQPIIICPARGIIGMRVRSEYKQPIEEGRLLILSPFAERQHRATIQTALYRNRFVAALADYIFVAYAEPFSKIEQFCREMLTWGKSLYTLESDANINLISLGAKPVKPDNVFEWA